MAAKRELPNLENATVGFCLDQIVNYRDVQKDAKFYEGIYRQKLETLLSPGQKTVSSDLYSGEFIEVAQERLDTEKIRSDLSREELLEKGWLKVIPMVQLKTVKK